MTTEGASHAVLTVGSVSPGRPNRRLEACLLLTRTRTPQYEQPHLLGLGIRGSGLWVRTTIENGNKGHLAGPRVSQPVAALRPGGTVNSAIQR